MKKVLLINQGHTDNLGDKVINQVMSKMLSEKYEVEVMNYIPTEQSRNISDYNFDGKEDIKKSKVKDLLKKSIYNIISDYYIYNYKYKKSIKNKLKNKQFDLVVIGGGELISSFHPFVSAFSSWVSMSLKYLKCPIVVFGVSGDLPKDLYARKKYRKYLSKCSYINVRDNNTVNILENNYNIKANYSPDCGFLYKKIFNNINNIKENKVVVMIHSYEEIKDKFNFNNEEEYFEYWLDLINKNTKQDEEIVLAYTTYVDKVSCIRFEKYLKHNKKMRNISIENTDELEKLINLFSKSKIIITGRMHAMILGMSYENKIIPYVFKEKIAVFKDEWIDKDKNLDKEIIKIEHEFKNLHNI